MALGGNNEWLSSLYRFKKNTGCLWEFPPPLKGVCPFLKLDKHRDKEFDLQASQQSFREGNGTPLQYSCLENPVDGGAWWAAVHGVAKSRHDWATSLSLFTFMHCSRKWQPTPVFLPGESQGRRNLVGCRLWGHTESDTTEVTSQQQQQQSLFLVFMTLAKQYQPPYGLDF